jgi:hypothetical protein
MLKILLLVQAQQRAILDRFYDGIASASDCDVRRLEKDDQKHLKRYLNRTDLNTYDYVLLMTRAKYSMKQTRFLKTLSNLVFLEHDACQNYIKHSDYKGKFSKFYKNLPSCTVIASGFQVTQKLREEGIDCHFIAKGYDQTMLSNLGLERDIDCAFVGSITNEVYKEREEFLSNLKADGHIQILRTASGEDYLHTLNRIRFFISADIGLGEYMLKNFEAMACGCIVFAYDQGTTENQALGFKDMENIVLYRTKQQLLEKIERIRGDDALATAIQEAGQHLVESRFRFEKIGKTVTDALCHLKINSNKKIPIHKTQT